MRHKRKHGFTLIELLIAMAILAIAMGALLQTSARHAANSVSIRDRAFAQWVASNKLVELQTQSKWEAVGKRDGEMRMANTTWYWRTVVEKVTDEHLRRVEVSVRKNEDSVSTLYTLPGFLASDEVYGGSNPELTQ